MTQPNPSPHDPRLVAALERAALTAVPAPRVAFDGAFVVRGFAGGTGRANAASSLDPSPDPDLEARVARIEADYARWGLPPRFRLTPLDPPGLEALLERRGYRDTGETLVMAGPLASLAVPDPAAEIEGAPGPDWTAVLATAEHQTPARRDEKARAVAMLARPACWCLIRQDGVPAAGLHAVADGRFCGLFDVSTDPRFRRRGLARRALGAGLDWARGLGADTAWLQVDRGNHGAVALYAAMGLRQVYAYRYRVRD